MERNLTDEELSKIIQLWIAFCVITFCALCVLICIIWLFVRSRKNKFPKSVIQDAIQQQALKMNFGNNTSMTQERTSDPKDIYKWHQMLKAYSVVPPENTIPGTASAARIQWRKNVRSLIASRKSEHIDESDEPDPRNRFGSSMSHDKIDDKSTGVIYSLMEIDINADDDEPKKKDTNDQKKKDTNEQKKKDTNGPKKKDTKEETEANTEAYVTPEYDMPPQQRPPSESVYDSPPGERTEYSSMTKSKKNLSSSKYSESHKSRSLPRSPSEGKQSGKPDAQKKAHKHSRKEKRESTKSKDKAYDVYPVPSNQSVTYYSGTVDTVKKREKERKARPSDNQTSSTYYSTTYDPEKEDVYEEVVYYNDYANVKSPNKK